MTLVSPRIVGPVSPLSTVVRMTGHGPGAVVEVVAIDGTDERQIARDTPSSAFDGYVALGSIRLREGEWLATRQTDAAGDKSALLPASERVQVLAEPTAADATAVAILTHASICAECLYIDGAYPGAEVSIYDSTGVLRGSTLAIGTLARLGFAPGLDSSGYTVRQQLGPYTGPSVAVGDPDYPFPIRMKRPPAPQIVEPVTACSLFVGLDDVIGGATVRLRRLKRGSLLWDEDLRCVDVQRVMWPVADLEKGDLLAVRQTLCGAHSEEREVTVLPAAVRTPWVLPPCERDDRVVVFELEPGAEVDIRIEAGGSVESIRGYAYGPVCGFALPLGTLRRGARVSVRQRMCGLERESPAVKVEVHVPNLPPRIDGPLRACATRVRVRNVPPGATVKLLSQNHRVRSLEGCIGSAIALPAQPFVDVSVLALQPNDTVWPVLVRCGTLVEGLAEGVIPVFDVGPPRLEPVTTCGRIVVSDVIAGATVEIFVDGRHAGGPVVSPTTVCTFPRPSFLTVGSTTYARQRACGTLSSSSNVQSATLGKLEFVETRRIRQITGEFARLESPAGSFEVSPNRTQSRYGLEGMDLGVVVEHLGEQVLLFGDSTIRGRPPLLRPIGLVREYPVDLEDGLSLDFLTNRDEALVPLGVLDPPDPATGDRGAENHGRHPDPTVHDEGFFVPTGAFSYDGKLYVFVMESVGISATAHFRLDGTEDTAEFNRKERLRKEWEAKNFGAPGGRVVGGRSVLVSSATLSGPFTREATLVDIRDIPFNDLPVRWRFSQCAPVVVDLATFPELGATGDGLFVWGAGAYRQSDVTFAWTPLQRGRPVPPPSAWNYFVGTDPAGRPLFVQGIDNAIGILEWSSTGTVTTVVSYKPLPNPADLEKKLVPPLYEVGEFSVAYITDLSSWLLLHDGVHAYLADKPWGPWRPGGPGLHVLPRTVITTTITGGSGIYAPYMLPRYTRWDESSLSVQVYFVGSHFDHNIDPHGQVQLFRTSLRCIPV